MLSYDSLVALQSNVTFLSLNKFSTDNKSKDSTLFQHARDEKPTDTKIVKRLDRNKDSAFSPHIDNRELCD